MDAEELLSFAAAGPAVGRQTIDLAARPEGCAARGGRTPGCGHSHLHLTGRMMRACDISSMTPVLVVKSVHAEDGRGATGPLEAHSPGRCQRAAI